MLASQCLVWYSVNVERPSSSPTRLLSQSARQAEVGAVCCTTSRSDGVPRLTRMLVQARQPNLLERIVPVSLLGSTHWQHPRILALMHLSLSHAFTRVQQLWLRFILQTNNALLFCLVTVMSETLIAFRKNVVLVDMTDAFSKVCATKNGAG